MKNKKYKIIIGANLSYNLVSLRWQSTIFRENVACRAGTTTGLGLPSLLELMSNLCMCIMWYKYRLCTAIRHQAKCTNILLVKFKWPGVSSNYNLFKLLWSGLIGQSGLPGFPHSYNPSHTALKHVLFISLFFINYFNGAVLLNFSLVKRTVDLISSNV